MTKKKKTLLLEIQLPRNLSSWATVKYYVFMKPRKRSCKNTPSKYKLSVILTPIKEVMGGELVNFEKKKTKEKNAKQKK